MREMLFVGTYTEPILFGTGEILESRGKGIHVVGLDGVGKLSLVETVSGVRNPSFLCTAKNNTLLYAVNELKNSEGEGGFVSSFAIETPAGNPTLRFLNSMPTRGGDPCHVVANQQSTHVYVSNFMSGSVCVFPILPDGSLGEACDFIQYAGNSIDPRRQKSPHAHSLTFDASQKRAFVPDLGTDKLMAYETDFSKGRLHPSQTPFMKTRPGDGPRYMEFHPNGKWAYLINELASGVSLLDYNEQDGVFSCRQIVSTLPEQFSGDNICADLHVTADGKFLYASNRGHDSLACFRIAQDGGVLERLFIIPSGGKTPRNFCISSLGEYLVVANQDSDTLISFRIDHADGSLVKIDELTVHTPVCVRPSLFV